jgi:Holliday junction resolvase RusA-like endonuclease
VATYKLRIDRWQPATLNKLLGCHWASAARLKKTDKNMVGHYCNTNRVPLANGPREVRLTITLAPKQRAPDPDAYWKSTLDALVHAQMLIDDNRQYCRPGVVNFVRGTERSTLIELEDL